MSADFNTFANLKATKEDMLALLKIIKQFEDEESNDIYIEFVRLNKNRKELMSNSSIYITNLKSEDDMKKYIETLNGEVFMESMGPYGGFEWLDETKIFEKLAEVAPDSCFSGSISGFNAGGQQYLMAELLNGKLNIITKYESDEEYGTYIDYVMETLPYGQFLELFGIDQEDFSEDDYNDFIDEMIAEGNIYDCNFDDFQDFIATEPSINEDEYYKVIEVIKGFKIKSLDEYEEENMMVSKTVYDPISKKYI